ncbi:MAG: type VI secretion system ATPase TssH, partial [Bacteroidota bacterium]
EDLEAVGEKHRTEIIETTKAEVFELLKDNLRPEFLNRIDEQIMFLPLSREEIHQILELLLRKTKKMLNKQGIKLRLTDKAKDYLANLGYDPQFGARPLKRVLQREVVNELSKLVLSGDFSTGDTIEVDTQPKGLVFNKLVATEQAE